MQCFLNEYVYDVGTDEANAADQLERLLSAALERGNRVPPRLVAAVACYRPLHSIARHERLLDLDTPPALADLIRQQVAEPLQERRLAAQIPRLTPIRDAVSSGVRRQYEENPYPRWSSLPTDLVKLSFPDYLKRRLPTVDIGTIPGQPGARIHALNAGCGTGQHPSNMVLRIDSMHLLAVDLSLSSLAHATRKAKELELSNVAFAQADILELGRLPTRYDLIESIGVLHHLDEPSVGLGVLCRLLNDGGIIRLGLYSELGRRSIVACRDDIQRRGIRSDPDAIRQYRSELRQLDWSDPRKGATRFADFYSLSECRDLLFHVHERRFTVRTLQSMLESHDLEFLGFDLEPDQIASFRRSHPDPSSLTDFDAWDAHERSYPDTFSRMYMAWARKRHRSSAQAFPPGARNNGVNPR
jgi:SAM-dependent methyltransferase